MSYARTTCGMEVNELGCFSSKNMYIHTLFVLFTNIYIYIFIYIYVYIVSMFDYIYIHICLETGAETCVLAVYCRYDCGIFGW